MTACPLTVEMIDEMARLEWRREVRKDRAAASCIRLRRCLARLNRIQLRRRHRP